MLWSMFVLWCRKDESWGAGSEAVILLVCFSSVNAIRAEDVIMMLCKLNCGCFVVLYCFVQILWAAFVHEKCSINRVY